MRWTKPWSRKQKLLSEFEAWRASMQHLAENRRKYWELIKEKAARGEPCIWCDDCKKVGFAICLACGQAIITHKTLNGS